MIRFRLPRWLARIAAGFLGYFWLPCPRCGREFAGFEVRAMMPAPDRGPGRYLGTCCPPYEEPREDGEHLVWVHL